jgi:hypothetical protein
MREQLSLALEIDTPEWALRALVLVDAAEHALDELEVIVFDSVH